MIKLLAKIFVLLLLVSCTSEVKETKIETASEILKKSISKHDPTGKWNQSIFSLHIQEPRVGNPGRYSIVKFDLTNPSFELIRNRDEHLSRHVVDKNGAPKVFLDDKEEFDESLIEKYRLNPDRNFVYRNSYKMMYGLPMSLNEKTIDQMGQAERCVYNGHQCFKIPIELKEEMFSKYWRIFISEEDYIYRGMEIYFPDDTTKGERLYFDGSIQVEGMYLPQMRHWHELTDDSYSGSDIIVKQL